MKNKIIFLSILITAQAFFPVQTVRAETATLFFSPSPATYTVGTSFDSALQLNPSGNEVCVISGTFNFENLSCRGIAVTSGLAVVTAPSCETPNFLIGIPKCTTVNKSIFTLTLQGPKAGQGNLSVANVKVIGPVTDVVSVLQAGTYIITSPAVKPPVVTPPATKPPVVTPPAVTPPAVTPPVANPMPVITSVSPNFKTLGDSDFTLTLNGEGFLPNSFVNFAGLSRETTYVSPTQITAKIIAFDLSTAGTFSVTVTNPLPGGGASNLEKFQVVKKTPPPQVPVKTPLPSQKNNIIIIAGIIILLLLLGILLYVLFRRRK